LQIHLKGRAEHAVPPIAEWNDREFLAEQAAEEDPEGVESDKLAEAVADDENEKLGAIRVVRDRPLDTDEQVKLAMNLEWYSQAGDLLRGALLNAFVEGFCRHWQISEQFRADLLRGMVRHLFHEMVRDHRTMERAAAFLDELREDPPF
jgi:hypothetical protein